MSQTLRAWLGAFLLLAVQNPQLVRIDGIVVNSSNGEPIPNVTVNLNPRPQPGMSVQRLTATSDKDGKFTMPSVVPAVYGIVPQRNGFVVPQRKGLIPELSVLAGQNIKDLEIEMIPAAVVTGRVVDENGEPRSGALVQVMEVVYRDGRRMLGAIRGPGGTTDERGEYRVSNVEPGEYYVRALPSTGATFGTSYYPGVAHPADAAKVVVPVGSDLSAIDIALPRGELHTVRFKVRSALPMPPNTPLGFFLAPQDRANLHVTPFSTPFDSTGDDTYVTPRLSPGEYAIKVAYGTSGNALGVYYLNVNIADKDIDAGTLVVQPGRPVTVRLLNLEALPPGTKVDQIIVRPTLVDGPPLFPSARLGSDGTAKFSRMAPEPFQSQLPDGRYRVEFAGLPSGFYVSSAKFNGAEVLDHGMVVDGDPKGPLEFSIASGAATVSGTVRDDKDEIVTNSRVVLVPPPNRRGTLTVFPTTVTTSSGTFSITGLAPGDYGALAIDYVGSDAGDRFYTDPEFLKNFERRVERLTVAPGSTHDVKLRLIPISK